ncbi:MAG: adenylyl-sulfate kinase [Lachnospiraceae bacterium]|nr:adenylyl-sulfate kinase [Lachnospiraceae bacterium]
MKGLLKFITCGSVDDGKSTLIGHMLYDAKLLYADQERALELDSKLGSRAGEIDYSLLLDGLMAEREQGITIDVAYRYFTTDRRSFIVADTPGHEEYTRNMAVGASFADLAVILVDATQGILIQTKRHARICELMGIRHFVFAINKMDLVHYDEHIYKKIDKEIRKLAIDLDLHSVVAIPVSATEGDNVTNHLINMPWYDGKTLLEYLEDVDTESEEEKGFLLPIQRVCRPNHMFRGFQGQVECGKVFVGDEIKVLPSGETARIEELFNADRKVNEISQGQAVTVRLDKEVDVSRGCVLVKDTELKISDIFQSTILWMDDDDLVEGKTFLLKIGTKMLPATVMNIKYRIDVNSGEHVVARKLKKNEIAVCEFVLSEKIVFDCFKNHRGLGHFILIDRVTNMTSACGIINHEMRRGDNLFYQKMDITRELRSNHMNQKPVTLWFTGLSGAGKSTLANEIEKKLVLEGKCTMSLDGDNVRMGLNKDLGFSEEDRIENIRRISEVAKLMNDAGLIVMTSFISPYRADRRKAREIIGEDNFIEIYVCTSLEECEKRDVKGLYKKARSGKIPNFTGINSPYEVPQNPEIVVDTANMTIDEAAEYIINELKKHITY